MTNKDGLYDCQKKFPSTQVHLTFNKTFNLFMMTLYNYSRIKRKHINKSNVIPFNFLTPSSNSMNVKRIKNLLSVYLEPSILLPLKRSRKRRRGDLKIKRESIVLFCMDKFQLPTSSTYQLYYNSTLVVKAHMRQNF